MNDRQLHYVLEANNASGVQSHGTTQQHAQSLFFNNSAVADFIEGRTENALHKLREALRLDPKCGVAESNLVRLREWGFECGEMDSLPCAISRGEDPSRVAVLSFLFNWPSTGGGIVHTVELTRFLAAAGYVVRHFYAVYPPWGIGKVQGALPIESTAIPFDDSGWNSANIRDRFRVAVTEFDPDAVIIMDSWNFKPHLAEAVRDFPYFLRFQALECLCPLNNLRLMPKGSGQFEQCPRHQFATPSWCYQCLLDRGESSGALHKAERLLAGVGSKEYEEMLRKTLWEAEGVLVLNRLTEGMLSPFARRTHVVPWGMDPARFAFESEPNLRGDDRIRLLLAGIPEEAIKGFHVALDACERLWKKRRDFELLVTGDPPGLINEFTRFVGWHSQADLPGLYRWADIVLVPTIAQEGLSRTSVEAMAAGRPVIGSRIGGLPETISDWATGFLTNPGDALDLAEKIEILLDNPDLRRRMGNTGRQRFEKDFTWPVVIERYYRPLLKHRQRIAPPT